MQLTRTGTDRRQLHSERINVYYDRGGYVWEPEGINQGRGTGRRWSKWSGERGVSSASMGLLRKRDRREVAGISHPRVLLEEEQFRRRDRQSHGPQTETDLGSWRPSKEAGDGNRASAGRSRVSGDVGSSRYPKDSCCCCSAAPSRLTCTAPRQASPSFKTS